MLGQGKLALSSLQNAIPVFFNDKSHISIFTGIQTA